MTAIAVIGLACVSTALLPKPAGADEQSEFRQAIGLFQQKNFEASREALVKLVKARPRNALYWFNLGNALYMLGRYPAAVTCFAKVEDLRSPLAPAARLYQAKALRATGRPDASASASDLLRTLEADPSTPKSLRDAATTELRELSTPDAADRQLKTRALASYRNARYADALTALNAIHARDDDVRLLTAMTLVKLGRRKQAAELMRSIRSGALAVDRRELIADLALEVEDDADRPLRLSLDASGGYGSNVYLDPSSVSPVGEAIARASVALSGQAWSSAPWSLAVAYGFDAEETAHRTDLRLLTHSLSAAVARESDAVLVQLAIVASHETWGTEAAVAKYGGRLRARRELGAYELGLDLEALQVVPQLSSLSYLEGSSETARLYVGLGQNKIYGQLALEWERQRSGDLVYSDGAVLPSAYQGWGPSGRFVWRIAERWILSAQASLKLRTYPTPSAPNGTARDDRALSTTVAAIRVFSPELSAYLSASHAATTSTLGPDDVRDENQSGQRYFLGVTWDIL